jgi:hypothetical protein
VLAVESYTIVGGIFGFLYLIFIIYCAIVTAAKRHLLLFILGFFCGFAWIIGLFAEDRRELR